MLHAFMIAILVLTIIGAVVCAVLAVGFGAIDAEYKKAIVAGLLLLAFSFSAIFSGYQIEATDHNNMKTAITDEYQGSTHFLLLGSHTMRFTKPNGSRCTATFSGSSTSRISNFDCTPIQ